MTRKEYNNRDIEIENRLTNVEQSLEEIKLNHLPHIESKIDRLLWFLVTTAFALASGSAFIIFKIQ